MLQMRKEIALKLHKDGMTQQAIATRLKVSQAQISADLSVALSVSDKAKQPRKTDTLGRPASPGRPRLSKKEKDSGKERRMPASKTTTVTKRDPELGRIEKLEKTYKLIRKIRAQGIIPHRLYRGIKAVLHHPENVSAAKLQELRTEWDVYGWLMAEKHQPTPTLTDVGISVKEKSK